MRMWAEKCTVVGLIQILTYNITLHFCFLDKKIMQHRTQNKNIQQSQYSVPGNTGCGCHQFCHSE